MKREKRLGKTDVRQRRLKLYNELASIIYNDIKDYVDSNDELTYIEVIGVLEQLKTHFATNTTISITDIRIKRDIKKDFSK